MQENPAFDKLPLAEADWVGEVQTDAHADAADTTEWWQPVTAFGRLLKSR